MKLSKTAGPLLVALACAAVFVAALPHEQPEEAKDATAHVASNKSGLLNFANYRKLFNKSYSGFREEAARWKYFTASALQTFASAIKYKFRKQNHFSALNDMSDWSPEEFAMMENKELSDWVAKELPESNKPVARAEDSLPEFMPGDHENITKGLQELMESHKGDPVYDELAGLLGDRKREKSHHRRKRDTGESSDEPLPPRDLPFDRLINTGEGADEPSPGVRAKLRNFVPSNNPNYQGIDLPTQGLQDNQMTVKWHSIESDDTAMLYMDGFLADVAFDDIERKIMAEDARKRTKAAVNSKKNAASLPDAVFTDLRETNCIAPIRSQGKCASCYAFAGITILEYLYCKATGNLVPFSEQYIMDCGKDNMIRLNGCSGGNAGQVGHFARNFGMHLRSMYPYTAKEGICPYDPDHTEYEQTGYIRSDDFSNSLIIGKDFWPDALKHGPFMVCVTTSREFKHYRSGVFMGGEVEPQDCRHLVTLIGHGREDGREYWLIRNSWGTKWGEGGYGKIDKESEFLKILNFGFMYGVKNPKRIAKMNFFENESHDESLLEEVASKAAYTKMQDKPGQEFKLLRPRQS